LFARIAAFELAEGKVVDVAEILPADSESNVGVRSYAIDPAAAKRLWFLSERLTGIKFSMTQNRS